MALLVKRGSNKHIMEYGVSDMWKYYTENGGTIDRRKYSLICGEMNDLLLREVVFNNYTVKLPMRLGDVSLVCLNRKMIDGKIDRKKMKVDWQKTHNYWMENYGISTLDEAKKIENKKLFYCFNEHTDGKYLFWYWRRGAVKNIKAYCFDINRGIKRTAVAYVKKIGEMPYYTLKREQITNYNKQKDEL